MAISISYLPTLFQASQNAYATFSESTYNASSIAFLEIYFGVHQPEIGKKMIFAIDGRDYSIEVEAAPFKPSHIRPPLSGEDLQDYYTYFRTNRNNDPQFSDFIFTEIQGGGVSLAARNNSDFKYSVGSAVAFDFTKQVCIFYPGANPQNQSCVVEVFEEYNQNRLYKSRIAIEQGSGRLDLSELSSFIQKSIPTSIASPSPEKLNNMRLRGYLKHYENYNFPIIFSDEFVALGGHKNYKSNPNYPSGVRPFLLQESSERVAKMNGHDWMLVYFPVFTEFSIVLYEYDKDNTVFETILSSETVQRDDVLCIASGAGQLSLQPQTVRYNVQLLNENETSFLGVSYTIDCNYYQSDYEILYHNHLGGFSMFVARGTQKQLYKVATKTFRTRRFADFLETETAEVTEKMMSIDFNTGYFTENNEVQSLYDVIGAEIYVIIPNPKRFVKMIVETNSFSIEKANLLHNVTFTARFQNDL